jgi:hypothetical protein
MNKLLLAALIGLFLGFLNGYYWSRQGYRGWHIYFLGSIAFFGLASMVLKYL